MYVPKKFVFVGHEVDLARGTAAFHYSIQSVQERQDFTERIYFPPVINQVSEAILKSMLDNLLLALGMSYWKLYCPEEISITPFSLEKDQANFWNTVYTKGLGEFFYKNKIDFRGLVNFSYEEGLSFQPTAISLKDRALLGLGGGKDSIVVAELLKSKNKNFDLFIVGSSRIQKDVAKIIGKETITIERKIDEKLFELNRRGGVYNGHVPISVIYAFLASFAGLLYDYNNITVANEKSSNYGNVVYLGEEINHQWSKSEEFENLFRNYLRKYLTPSLSYSSYLRDYDELQVVEIFIKHKEYFPYFSSCNTNFKINEKRDGSSRWCGKCPKCLFVFIILSGFISKEELIEIFNKNLFNDESLLPVFKELLGMKDFKPFECVGTPKEVTTALDIAYKRGELNNTILMKFYKDET